ncbi:hypothetical protein ATY39_14100 [Rummeliibacillus stabekisii]|uniref:HTH cro/C1-type domain-containing protein n=2 Tax=Rummeliibacillus stabekisii TaxID=241244 RepID=A0A143HHB5_9BACL|nr:hypothetical protein ATY39_14100 [Rummeliibacillus stabekisii]
MLKQLRKDKNLTQQELAEEIGISSIYVRKIEKGAVKPGRETLILYENYFGISMRELFPDIFFIINDKKCINEQRAI